MSSDNIKYVYTDIETGEIYENAESALKAKHEKQKEAKHNESNKNPAFIQLTKGVSPEVLANIADDSATAIKVLMFFFKNMDDYNVIMVSQNVIAESINKTKRAVANAIKVLEKHGAIGIAKVSNANVYIINPEIAWQKGFKQRGVVKMKAVVMLGEDENKKLFNRFKSVHQVSKETSLKIDNVATKIAVKKPKTQPKEQTDETPLSVEDLDELEQDYNYSDSVLPEDVPPWEDNDL